MARHLVLVDNLRDWPFQLSAVEPVSVKDYLRGPAVPASTRVINLCRSYRYASTGYYGSLLAEARGNRILPTVRTITDLASRSIYSLNSEDLDERVDRRLRQRREAGDLPAFEILVAFGRCDADDLLPVAQELFASFPCPLLRVEFRHQERWRIGTIRPVQIGALNDRQRQLVEQSLEVYIGRTPRRRRTRPVARYDMAILHNPDETLPPSNPGALRKFIAAGKRVGIEVDLITRRDFSRLAEYDALFIRETTAIGHHTYRFAQRADREGLVVIDDPESILRCTNKIYLTELLQRHNLPVPRTRIAIKGETGQLQLGNELPLVLKIPDGSFSRGVYRADSVEQAHQILAKLHGDSDLVILQQYLYTEFDWRVTLLDGDVLFACQYFMSRAHWQIVRHRPGGRSQQGRHRTFAAADVPAEVIETARRAASLVGSGLYGVDLKQFADRVYVMEINDNPNIDAGVEDRVLGEALYDRVIGTFLDRLNRITVPG